MDDRYDVSARELPSRLGGKADVSMMPSISSRLVSNSICCSPGGIGGTGGGDGVLEAFFFHLFEGRISVKDARSGEGRGGTGSGGGRASDLSLLRDRCFKMVNGLREIFERLDANVWTDSA